MTAPARPDLAELRQLLAKATERPWASDGQGSAFGFYGADDDRIMSASDHWSTNAPSDEDAALIVAAVNAPPGLLDWIEALERTIEVMNHPRYGELRALAAEPNSSNVMTAEDFRKRLSPSPSGSPEPQISHE